MNERIYAPGAPECIIVSRHSGAVEYLRQHKVQVYIDAIGKNMRYDLKDARVVEHASTADVFGNVVVGNLPLELAQYAYCVISPVMRLPKEMRGRDLTAAEMQQYCRGLRVYHVSGDYAADENGNPIRAGEGDE